MRYTVEAEPTDRVLDALHHIKWTIDGTLSLRRSCGHGVCGSDAMMINGRNALACQLLLRDEGTEITVELRVFPVIKDLVVDIEAGPSTEHPALARHHGRPGLAGAIADP